MLVDSHCHLDYLARDGDLEGVVGRARAAGVGRMLTICTKISAFDEVHDIAHRYDDVWCSVGIHPHEAATEAPVTAEGLIALAADAKVVGIGETGLDYFYEHSPREAQKRSFREHIAAARATGLPLIVHARDADEDIAEILCEEHAKGPYAGVLHCFSSGPTLAQAALELGLYISLSGIVTFKKSDALREIVRNVPLNRILVETDAPYLAPVPKRGKRNEPAFIVHTAAAVAEIKGIRAEELAAATSENFFNLFNCVERPSAQ